MLENPLIRFLGSAIALASLPAIEIFGSIEQRPTPAIFVIVLVTRIDEILGHDVSRHFQSGEITVKLASHSLAGETAGCQGILWYAVENYLRSYGIRFVGKQLRGVAVGVVTVLMPVSVVGAVWPPSCRQSHG